MDIFRKIERIVCCFSTLFEVRYGERACVTFSDENKAHYIRLKYIIILRDILFIHPSETAKRHYLRNTSHQSVQGHR